jgi:integrase/recombinase XerD
VREPGPRRAAHPVHESVTTTQIYLHADLALKEQALARTKPPNGRTGRYHPPDNLIAWLEAL